MRFLEVPVYGDERSVREALFGTTVQAERAAQETARPPGDAGASLTLLYLSGLEQVDTRLWQALHRLVTRRRYFDALGDEWLVSEDLWIVGAFRRPFPTPTLQLDHFLPTSFATQMQVHPPADPDDLADICQAMTAELSPSIRVEPGVVPFVRSSSEAGANLHTLRRWMHFAARRAANSGLLTSEHVQAAMVQDIEWSLTRLVFRGRQLSSTLLDTWLEQFPTELRATAIHLARRIAEDYYVDIGSFHQALEQLIRASGIPRGSRVLFCRWQALGGSADRVANALKNQAGWRAAIDIDLNRPSTWRALSPEHARWLVLADDFVGSGKQLASLFNREHGLLTRLLARYPGCQIRILIVLGFEAGLHRARRALRGHVGRAKLFAARLLADTDRCFANGSRIIAADQQAQLRSFCIDAATRHMPDLKPSLRLGFQGSGAVVVFFDSVPNNSLPILWHGHGTWRPLFPRYGW